MTPKTLSVLVVRLIVFYLLLLSLGTLGITIYDVTVFDRADVPGAAYQLIVPLSYFVILILVLKFSGPIAGKISDGLPAIPAGIPWTATDVTVAILQGITALIVLSAIPMLVNNLYAILEANRQMKSEGLAEKERLDRLFLGLFGTLIQVAVAVVVSKKARRLAAMYEIWQK